MRRTSGVLTTLLFGAASALVAGCGDNGRNANGPGGGDDAPPDGAPSDTTPPDAAPPSCDIAWRDVQIGTELDDQVWGLATDANHNLYVAGFEHGVTGVSDIDPGGDSHGVVIKLDPAGTVQWKAMLDTAATDTVEGVAIEPASGLVYAVGRTSGAFEGFVNEGQFDAFLVAVDSRGQAAKVFQVGDARPQHPTRLSLGPDHQVAVAGYDDIFIEGNAVEGLEDGFVASFERGASPQDGFTEDFLQKVPTTAQNRATDVAVERDGSGSMYVTSMVSSGRAGGVFVKKLARDGSTLWSTKISSVTVDAANAVALSPSNELFVSGATFLMLGAQSFGQQDAYVLKLDKATGSIVWAAQAGSANSDFPTAMAFDDAGNIYVAGHTFFPTDPNDPTIGNLDPFAMKFDATGALVSTWRGGTPQDEFVTSLAVDRCGHAYVGGYTKGTMVTGGAGNAGGWDMFVVRPVF